MQLIIPVAVLGIMGLLFGSGLALASKIFEVKQDERIPLVREALPGANCGGCGYPGCDALAEAIVKGEAPCDACPVGRKKAADKIAEIMGETVEESEPVVARVHCQGSEDVAPERAQYYGVQDCREAFTAGGGCKGCSYGCLGYGSCVAACPFDAITMGENGIPVIDEELCTACGNCVATCPKDVISLSPKNNPIVITCNNKYKGKYVKPNCSVGCIACRLCARECPQEAISIVDNLAVIDYDKCDACGLCIEKCRSGVIKNAFPNEQVVLGKKEENRNLEA